MSVLTNRDINCRVGSSIVIWPFKPENLNTSSYDVSLGRSYYQERRPSMLRRLLNPVYNIWDLEHIRRVWEGPFEALPLVCHKQNSWRHNRGYKGIREHDRVIFLRPGHSILAHTEEFIGARRGATTRMQARSSYGRNFITVCRCAGWGDVGYFNRWTMEITNNSLYHTVLLVAGRRIAQMIFLTAGEIEGEDYSATGKYQHGSVLSEVIDRWRPEDMLPRLNLDRENPELRSLPVAEW